MSKMLYCADVVIARSEEPPIIAGAVLVENGQITAVGRQEDFGSAFAGCRKNFPGAAIMPGLFDSHLHSALDSDIPNWREKVIPASEAEHVLRSVAGFAKDLSSGVTSARSMADLHFIDIGLRDYERQGKLDIPRLWVAGRGLKAAHAHGLVGYSANGLEGFRKALRENVTAGSDFIKLYVTDAVLTANMPQYPCREEIALVVEEAHRVGLMVAVHCAGGPGFDACLDLGVDIFEHVYYLNQSQQEKLLKSNRWVVFTPTPPLSDTWYAHICAELADGYKRGRSKAAEVMRNLIKGGVRYAVGSDGRRGCLWKDMEFLCEAGATTAEALTAATRRGAELLGVFDRLGSLASGKLADFVVLNGNPRHDISALKNIRLVVKGGRAVYAAP